MIQTCLSSFALWIIVVAGVSVCSILLQQTQNVSTINIGVVISEDDNRERVIAKYIESIESVKAICDFKYIEEDDAMRGLVSGDLQAAIILPKSFYEEIYAGENIPARVCFPENMTREGIFFRRLLSAGVSLVRISEAGVYASIDEAKVYEINVPLREVGDLVVTPLVKTILFRDLIFERKVFSPFGSMTGIQYAIVSFFMISLLMYGMNFDFLYQKDNKVIEEVLRMKGVFAFHRSAVKVGIMISHMFFLSAVLYVLAYFLCELLEVENILFDGNGLLLFLLVSIEVAVYYHVVYSLVSDGIHGMGIVLICNVMMILVSGIVIPIHYFLEPIKRMGEILPLQRWSTLIYQALFDTWNGWDVAKTAVILAIGILVGGISQCKNT
ncbi:MAG: ABC transporter permease [Lachnospiraceae bacterium]|nr:ABC transporter permease [Lachnospiraceae bacterium]